MPTLGDHLKSSRGLYTHHGIYIGHNSVIHYSGLSDGIKSGAVTEVSLKEFCAGNSYEVVRHYNRKYSRRDSIQRAKGRLNEDDYSITGNNCEHFVNWCIEGDHKSAQVDRGTITGSSALSTAAGLGSRAAVASAGAVTGLSGSGVMSGLASVGSIVGGGAVAGLGVLGGSGGLAAASIMNNTVLKDDENLEQNERDSRSVGRKATYAGAAAGTAGSIVAVSAAGTVGLSGTGITTGLAAIGGTVGGGMSAGVVLTTAAPVVAAAAVGYGMYKAIKWFKS